MLVFCQLSSSFSLVLMRISKLEVGIHARMGGAFDKQTWVLDLFVLIFAGLLSHVQISMILQILLAMFVFLHNCRLYPISLGEAMQ